MLDMVLWKQFHGTKDVSYPIPPSVKMVLNVASLADSLQRAFGTSYPSFLPLEDLDRIGKILSLMMTLYDPCRLLSCG